MTADHVAALAEVLSWASGEMTRWSDDAHPDHNRWSWRGDGHAEVLREEFRNQARKVLSSPAMRALLAEERVRALREAADEMEAVIADGDCAEVAAPVQGEVGRSVVVGRRDALYEEPHTWLREYADREQP